MRDICSGEPSTSWSEQERASALHSYDMLDTPREQDFDDLARTASDIFEAPIGVVNLVDTHRQFFKAEVGLGVRSTPLETAFCTHALLQDDVLLVRDASKDERFRGNPLVTGEPHLKSYAGALLKTPTGLPIGTICVLDYKVREFTKPQVELLRFLARQTMTHLELRKTVSDQRALFARAIEAEREKTRFERVVRQASDFIGLADNKAEVVFLNDAARELVGLSSNDPLPQEVTDYIAEEDHAVFHQEIRTLIRAGQSVERELRLRHLGTGERRTAIFTMFPVRDQADNVTGYGVVAKDISERKAEEELRAQLMAEASHRIKNTLALAQTITNQTLRTATDVEDARTRVSQRIAALAAAQDLLTSSQHESADIHDIVSGALALHAGDGDRYKIEGPQKLLVARQALGLSLALHELATNAAKYGALSHPDGTIAVQWSITDSSAFSFEWLERGGPLVSSPSRTGFGTRLLKRMVGPYFEGSVTIDYSPEGVRFGLEGEIAETGPILEDNHG